MRSLNVLHYPSLAREQKVFHRWWSSGLGVLLGAAMAWAWLHWQELQTMALLQEQSLLQSHLAARTKQAQEAVRRQSQWRLQSEQAAHLGRVAQHQQAWVALHDSLQTEAGQSGLRLERLHAEAEKIELHATATHVNEIHRAQNRLSEQLDRPLALTSLTTAPHGSVSFVWQTAWPTLQGLGLAPSPSAPAPATAAPPARPSASAAGTQP